MRAAFVGLFLGFIVAACTEPEEPEEPETFMCGGGVSCDVRSEFCSGAALCEGVTPSDPVCAPVPEACDGVASLECLGEGCTQNDEGGFSCTVPCS